MIFVDLADDWKVFIGRSDVAQEKAWLWCSFLSSLLFPPFPFEAFPSLTAHALFILSTVWSNTPLSLKLYVLKLHFYSKNFSKHFPNQNKSPVRVLRDGVLNHQAELK